MSNRLGQIARGFLAAALLAALAWSVPARGEEAAARAERFDGLIESLNASSERRARVLEQIYAELRGPDAREMHGVVREALFRPNSLILQGAAEALAMLGDANDAGDLEALLATTDKLEVKNTIIRLLPAFCLGSERARFNYIRYASGYDRVPDPSVLAPLRHPPLTRRGRLDAALESLQVRIVRILARQFDPVGAALRYVDDRLYSQAARRTIVYYTGSALGNDPGRWARIWAAQGDATSLQSPGEVEELRLSALHSLSDMGAEGLPEIIEAFRRLLSGGGPILVQAAFETMTVMCRTAFAYYAPLSAMSLGAEDAVEAENWRARRFASAAALARFAADGAAGRLGREADSGAFAALADCLGTALSYPPGFPDPDGGLALARANGLERLEGWLMAPDLSREKRAAVASALGGIGAARAVAALSSLLASDYVSPESGQDGMRLAEAAVDGLRAAATGKGGGMDAARAALLGLLGDKRVYAPLRAGTPPVGLAHIVLWRLQRLAKSNDTSLDREAWRVKLGW